MHNMKHIKSILDYFSRPVLLNYVLPVLMIYLVAGTIAQKYIGLYESTQMFFSSWIFFLGPVPLPGLPIFIALIFLNLLGKLVFKSPWRIENAGIIITHIGAMLLLLGGLFTALFSTEGYIDLAPGQQKAFVEDYHLREFAVLHENGEDLQTLPHSDLEISKTVDFSALPFSIKILETCRNCAITPRQNADESYIGMAQHMALSPGELNQTDEDNMAGLTFSVSGSDSDGVYVVLENVPQLPEITAGDQTYKLALRRQHRVLPFSVELLEFQRDMHVGTDLAKSYQSRVRIHDGAAQWDSLISMNEPLRYKGYTLFQSSFIATPKGDISVLAVVWNVGRAFPYISGIAMCLGLIIHLFMRRTTPKKRGQNVA